MVSHDCRWSWKVKESFYFLSDLFRSAFVCAATYVYKYVIICHTKDCISGNSLLGIVLLFPRAILPRHTIRNLSEAGKAPARPWPWLAPGAPGGKTSLEKVQKYRSGLVVGCIYFFLGCTSQPCAIPAIYGLSQSETFTSPLWGSWTALFVPTGWEGTSQPQIHQFWANSPKAQLCLLGFGCCSPLETRSVVPPIWGNVQGNLLKSCPACCWGAFAEKHCRVRSNPPENNDL